MGWDWMSESESHLAESARLQSDFLKSSQRRSLPAGSATNAQAAGIWQPLFPGASGSFTGSCNAGEDPSVSDSSPFPRLAGPGCSSLLCP